MAETNTETIDLHNWETEGGKPGNHIPEPERSQVDQLHEISTKLADSAAVLDEIHSTIDNPELDPTIAGSLAHGLEPHEQKETDAPDKDEPTPEPQPVKGTRVTIKTRGMSPTGLAQLASMCAERGWKWESTSVPIEKSITLPPGDTWPTEKQCYVVRTETL